MKYFLTFSCNLQAALILLYTHGRQPIRAPVILEYFTITFVQVPNPYKLKTYTVRTYTCALYMCVYCVTCSMHSDLGHSQLL